MDKKREYFVNYAKANREKMRENSKRFYYKNKEYVVCNCGKQLLARTMRKHVKSNFHIRIMELRSYNGGDMELITRRN